MADPAAADEAYIVAGGSIRVLGVAFDNVRDFKDSNGWFRDSESFYQTRFRLYTVAESRDLKARAVWALEVGDITWGAGGGASGGEFGCSGETPRVNSRITTVTPTSPVAIKVQSADPNTRVGPGSGGCLGSDGINVETKNLYIRFELPWWPWDSHARIGLAPRRSDSSRAHDCGCSQPRHYNLLRVPR